MAMVCGPWAFRQLFFIVIAATADLFSRGINHWLREHRLTHVTSDLDSLVRRLGAFVTLYSAASWAAWP